MLQLAKDLPVSRTDYSTIEARVFELLVRLTRLPNPCVGVFVFSSVECASEMHTQRENERER